METVSVEERYKPVIFLDIDGVLNTSRHMIDLHEAGKPQSDEFGHLFDPEAVEALERIIKKALVTPDIVISSTWRYQGLERMKLLWDSRKLPGTVVDITPDCVIKQREGSNFKEVRSALNFRGVEIAMWLKHNRPWDFENYCIIDDDRDMMLMQAARFVHTTNKYGLTDHHVPDALIALRGEHIMHDFAQIGLPWDKTKIYMPDDDD